MTQVTIERELLVQAIKALDLGYALLESSKSCHAQTLLSAYKELAGAALQAAPAQPVNQVLVDALKQFADALPPNRDTVKTCYAVTNGMRDAAHSALAQAQAQPSQVDVNEQGTNPVVSQNRAELIDKPAQGLTDDDIAELIVEHKVMDHPWPTQNSLTAFARAAIQKGRQS